MSYSLHPGAEQDVADALDFYAEQVGPLVAMRFLQEFERFVDLLVVLHQRKKPNYGGGRQ